MQREEPLFEIDMGLPFGATGLSFGETGPEHVCDQPDPYSIANHPVALRLGLPTRPRDRLVPRVLADHDRDRILGPAR